MVFSHVTNINCQFSLSILKETDMIIAPLTMTSEREEVIDFVAPYFDQSGISIGIIIIIIIRVQQNLWNEIKTSYLSSV